MLINTHKPYKIFAEVVSQGALEQFESAMLCDFAVKGALMPDVHLGYSLPIGAVVATEGVIVPAWIGFDIGCGMCAIKTGFAAEGVRSNAKQIFGEIYRRIPVGFHHNQKPSEWSHEQLRVSTKTTEIFAKNGLTPRAGNPRPFRDGDESDPHLTRGFENDIFCSGGRR